MNDETLRFILALTKIKELSNVLINRLLQKFNSVQDIFYADEIELINVEGLNNEKAKKIKNFNQWKDVDKLIMQCEKNNIKILHIKEKKYPQLLKEIYDPPTVIFCKGSIETYDHFGIAIVGSRKYSEYGRKVTEKIAYELSSYGLTIVSGLARGIDSIAHSSALSSNGRTIAVLGSGLSNIYPPENKALAEKISQHGAIITEFYPDEPPKKENFPKRNRIISGMSIGTVITEAAEKSGALITASYALEQGREIFAVPGNITSKNSEGTNFLIKKGAKIVQSVDDILEEIKNFIPSLKDSVKRQNNIPKVDLNEEENTVLNMLDEPLMLDEIVVKTNINVAKLLDILLRLEIKGVILKKEGKYSRRFW